MNTVHPAQTDTAHPPQEFDSALISALQTINVPADAALVNRTQRTVRERALAMRAQRRRSRDLWLACCVCSALVIMITHSAWSGLAQYDVNASGLLNPADILDASAQMLVMMLWFLPVTAAVLLLVWLKRAHNRNEQESVRSGNYRALPRVQTVR